MPLAPHQRRVRASEGAWVSSSEVVVQGKHHLPREIVGSFFHGASLRLADGDPELGPIDQPSLAQHGPAGEVGEPQADDELECAFPHRGPPLAADRPALVLDHWALSSLTANPLAVLRTVVGTPLVFTGGLKNPLIVTCLLSLVPPPLAAACISTEADDARLVPPSSCQMSAEATAA